MLRADWLQGAEASAAWDRQRRKQAEFLIHQSCPWALIEEIGVLNTGMKARVEEIFREFDAVLHKVVKVRADWFY